jgi:uncharacterized protein (DUF697 family)
VPLGVGIGQVVGLVREMRGLEGATSSIAVAGEGAGELAAALSAGGDASAVRVGGDPSRAVVAIRLLDGTPSTAEAAILRELSRAGVGVIVVQRGSGRVPSVLPGDVLDVGAGEVPLPTLVTAIARAAGGDGPALAGRLPVLRPAVARRLITTTALANAAVAASSKLQKAQLPVLTLAQTRMLLLLGVSRGESLPHDPQQLALATGPEIAGCIGMGFGARALVRRLPVGGPVVRALVAYAGTAGLGAARLRR